MIDVRLEIPIVPEAMPRPRASRQGGFARVFTPPKALEWKAKVALLVRDKLDGVAIAGPTRVDVAFVMPRPKYLQRKSDPPGLVWSTKRPDVDNLLKGLLDALRSFWPDDAQVCCGEATKLYAEKDGQPRIVLRISSAPDNAEDVLIKLGLLDGPTRRPAPPVIAPAMLPLFGGEP